MITRWLIFFLFTCACFSLQAQVNIITTIAGEAGVPASDSGDGSLATDARFYAPSSVCVDKQGNIYIDDAGNCKIRKINVATGIITTIAGTGVPGYSGDGGPATAAQLLIPSAARLDTFGNIYIADADNNRIRKIVAATGIITTIAGSDTFGYSGDGGPATNAELNGPTDLCLDNFGNIYIVDYFNNLVRKIDPAGIITTLAGTGAYGYSGDGGPATNAEFNNAVNVSTDSVGNIYISDEHNYVVRKVNALTGIITTFAGTGTEGNTGDGGLPIHAQLGQPGDVHFDNQNNIYIPDFSYGVVRKINAMTGVITTIAGDGTWGYSGDGGPATDAELSCVDLAFDSYGDMIIDDYGTNTIRMVYNPQLGVSNNNPQDMVKVYPNPATNELNVTGLQENTGYRLLSITGASMQQGILQQGSNTIAMKNFASGIYILEMTNADGQQNTVRVFKD